MTLPVPFSQKFGKDTGKGINCRFYFNDDLAADFDLSFDRLFDRAPLNRLGEGDR